MFLAAITLKTFVYFAKIGGHVFMTSYNRISKALVVVKPLLNINSVFF